MKQTLVKMLLVGIGAGAIAAVCMMTFGGKLLRDVGQQENTVVLTAETQVAAADEAAEESADGAESAKSENVAYEPSQEPQATEAETTPSQEPQVTEAEAETESSQETKAEETEISVNLPDQRTDEEIYEEMKEYLAALPDDADELAEQGCYVSTWKGALGTENLETFGTDYRAGEAADLVLAGYTEEGDVIFDYLKYNGEVLLWVHDSTRDGWAGGETYQCESGLYLSQFYRVQDGCTYRDFVLTDDPDLDYDEYYDTVWGDGLSEASIRLLRSVRLSDNSTDAEQPENVPQAW